MLEKISQLFKLEPSKKVVSDSVILQNGTNQNEKKESETYQQWGFRWAGQTQGSIYSLTPSLQVAINEIKRKQSKDKALQDKLDDQFQRQMNEKEAKLKTEGNDLEESKRKSENFNVDKADLKTKLLKLNNESTPKNKRAWANFIIGCIILVPLTIYLFIFYSSTSYSAFFKEFKVADMGLGASIFDPNALGNAASQSLTTLMFVILIAFVFLGLGYILHLYSIEENKTKYIKISALIITTFVFDALLAYLITKKIYNINSLTTLSNVPQYRLSMAFQDPTFWVVICCGFLAYIIWGLTFGKVFEAYSDYESNTTEKKNIKADIKNIDKKLELEKTNENAIKNVIADTEKEIQNVKLEQHPGITYVDVNIIVLEITNFYNGWSQYLSNAGKNATDRIDAKSAFDSVIKNLSNN
jgi:hypothetical protein